MSTLKIKKQRRFIKRQCVSIIGHLKSFSRLGRLEDLHEIRLRLKKLHSLASLSGKCTMHASLKKQIETAHPLFKFTGSIRTTELTMGLMNRYQVAATEYRQKLTGFIIRESKKLGCHVEGNIRKVKKLQRALCARVRGIGGDCIGQQYKERLIQLDALFGDPIKIDLIHAGRKMIKDLLYIYKIGKRSLKAEARLNTEYLNSLQDRIGKWHDIVSSEQQLRKKSDCCEEELTVFNRESDTLLEGIHDLSRDFLLKAIHQGPTTSSII